METFRIEKYLYNLSVIIKQFTIYNYSMGIESYVNRIGGNSNVAEERFESLNIVNCNGSLAYGDISFGVGLPN